MTRRRRTTKQMKSVTVPGIVEDAEQAIANVQTLLTQTKRVTTEASPLEQLESVLNELNELGHDLVTDVEYTETSIKQEFSPTENLLEELVEAVNKVEEENQKTKITEHTSTENYNTKFTKRLHTGQRYTTRKYPKGPLVQENHNVNEELRNGLYGLYHTKPPSKNYDLKKSSSEETSQVAGTSTTEETTTNFEEQESFFIGDFHKGHETSTLCVECNQTENAIETTKNDQSPKENDEDVLMFANQHETSTICQICDIEEETKTSTNHHRTPIPSKGVTEPHLTKTKKSTTFSVPISIKHHLEESTTVSLPQMLSKTTKVNTVIPKTEFTAGTENTLQHKPMERVSGEATKTVKEETKTSAQTTSPQAFTLSTISESVETINSEEMWAVTKPNLEQSHSTHEYPEIGAEATSAVVQSLETLSYPEWNVESGTAAKQTMINLKSTEKLFGETRKELEIQPVATQLEEHAGVTEVIASKPFSAEHEENLLEQTESVASPLTIFKAEHENVSEFLNEEEFITTFTGTNPIIETTNFVAEVSREYSETNGQFEESEIMEQVKVTGEALSKQTEVKETELIENEFGFTPSAELTTETSKTAEEYLLSAEEHEEKSTEKTFTELTSNVLTTLKDEFAETSSEFRETEELTLTLSKYTQVESMSEIGTKSAEEISGEFTTQQVEEIITEEIPMPTFAEEVVASSTEKLESTEGIQHQTFTEFEFETEESVSNVFKELSESTEILKETEHLGTEYMLLNKNLTEESFTNLVESTSNEEIVSTSEQVMNKLFEQQTESETETKTYLPSTELQEIEAGLFESSTVLEETETILPIMTDNEELEKISLEEIATTVSVEEKMSITSSESGVTTEEMPTISHIRTASEEEEEITPTTVTSNEQILNLVPTFEEISTTFHEELVETSTKVNEATTILEGVSLGTLETTLAEEFSTPLSVQTKEIEIISTLATKYKEGTVTNTPQEIFTGTSVEAQKMKTIANTSEKTEVLYPENVSEYVEETTEKTKGIEETLFTVEETENMEEFKVTGEALSKQTEVKETELIENEFDFTPSTELTTETSKPGEEYLLSAEEHEEKSTETAFTEFTVSKYTQVESMSEIGAKSAEEISSEFTTQQVEEIITEEISIPTFAEEEVASSTEKLESTEGIQHQTFTEFEFETEESASKVFKELSESTEILKETEHLGTEYMLLNKNLTEESFTNLFESTTNEETVSTSEQVTNKLFEQKTESETETKTYLSSTELQEIEAELFASSAVLEETESILSIITDNEELEKISLEEIATTVSVEEKMSLTSSEFGFTTEENPTISHVRTASEEIETLSENAAKTIPEEEEKTPTTVTSNEQILNLVPTFEEISTTFQEELVETSTEINETAAILERVSVSTLETTLLSAQTKEIEIISTLETKYKEGTVTNTPQEIFTGTSVEAQEMKTIANASEKTEVLYPENISEYAEEETTEKTKGIEETLFTVEENESEETLSEILSKTSSEKALTIQENTANISLTEFEEITTGAEKTEVLTESQETERTKEKVGTKAFQQIEYETIAVSKNITTLPPLTVNNIGERFTEETATTKGLGEKLTETTKIERTYFGIQNISTESEDKEQSTEETENNVSKEVSFKTTEFEKTESYFEENAVHSTTLSEEIQTTLINVIQHEETSSEEVVINSSKEPMFTITATSEEEEKIFSKGITEEIGETSPQLKETEKNLTTLTQSSQLEPSETTTSEEIFITFSETQTEEKEQLTEETTKTISKEESIETTGFRETESYFTATATSEGLEEVLSSWETTLQEKVGETSAEQEETEKNAFSESSKIETLEITTSEKIFHTISNNVTEELSEEPTKTISTEESTETTEFGETESYFTAAATSERWEEVIAPGEITLPENISETSAEQEVTESSKLESSEITFAKSTEEETIEFSNTPTKTSQIISGSKVEETSTSTLEEEMSETTTTFKQTEEIHNILTESSTETTKAEETTFEETFGKETAIRLTTETIESRSETTGTESFEIAEEISSKSTSMHEQEVENTKAEEQYTSPQEITTQAFEEKSTVNPEEITKYAYAMPEETTKEEIMHITATPIASEEKELKTTKSEEKKISTEGFTKLSSEEQPLSIESIETSTETTNPEEVHTLVKTTEVEVTNISSGNMVTSPSEEFEGTKSEPSSQHVTSILEEELQKSTSMRKTEEGLQNTLNQVEEETIFTINNTSTNLQPSTTTAFKLEETEIVPEITSETEELIMTSEEITSKPVNIINEITEMSEEMEEKLTSVFEYKQETSSAEITSKPFETKLKETISTLEETETATTEKLMSETETLLEGIKTTHNEVSESVQEELGTMSETQTSLIEVSGIEAVETTEIHENEEMKISSEELFSKASLLVTVSTTEANKESEYEGIETVSNYSFKEEKTVSMTESVETHGHKTTEEEETTEFQELETLSKEPSTNVFIPTGKVASAKTEKISTQEHTITNVEEGTRQTESEITEYGNLETASTEVATASLKQLSETTLELEESRTSLSEILENKTLHLELKESTTTTTTETKEYEESTPTFSENEISNPSYINEIESKTKKVLIDVTTSKYEVEEKEGITSSSEQYSKESEIPTGKLDSTTFIEELPEATMIFEKTEKSSSEIEEYLNLESVTQETSYEETVAISPIPEEESITTTFTHNEETEIPKPKLTGTTFIEELPEETTAFVESERTVSEIEEYVETTTVIPGILQEETVTISQKLEEETTAATFAYSKESEMSTRKHASTTFNKELPEATTIFEESERTAFEVEEYVETTSVTQRTSQEEKVTISYIPEEESATTTFEHNKEIEIPTIKFTGTTFTEELPEATRIFEGSERTASEIEEYESTASKVITTTSSKQPIEETSQSEEIETTSSILIESKTLYSGLTESTATSKIEEQVSNETKEYEENTATFSEKTFFSEIQYETKKTPTEVNHTTSFKEEINETTEFEEYLTEYEEQTGEKRYTTETALNEIKEYEKTESVQLEGHSTAAEQATELIEYEKNQTFAPEIYIESSSEIAARTTEKTEEQTNKTLVEVTIAKSFKEETSVATEFKEYLTEYEEEEITEKPNITVTLLNEMEEYEETASFQSEGPTATVYEGQKTTLEEYEGHQTFLQEMYAESSSVNIVGPTEEAEEKTKKSSLEAIITKYFKEELTETRETTEFKEYLTGYEEEEIPEKPNGTETISKEIEEYEETESIESKRPTTTVEEKQTTKLSEYEKNQTSTQEIYTEIPSEISVSITEQTEEQTNETLAEVTSTKSFKEETILTTEFKEYLSEYEEEEISEKSNGTVTALNEKTESFPSEELTTVSEEKETTKLSEYEENETFAHEIHTESLSENSKESNVTTEFNENLTEYEEESTEKVANESSTNGVATEIAEKTGEVTLIETTEHKLLTTPSKEPMNESTHLPENISIETKRTTGNVIEITATFQETTESKQRSSQYNKNEETVLTSSERIDILSHKTVTFINEEVRSTKEIEEYVETETVTPRKFQEETVTISQKSEEETTSATFPYSKENEMSTRKLASTTFSEKLSEATASEIEEYESAASTEIITTSSKQLIEEGSQSEEIETTSSILIESKTLYSGLTESAAISKIEELVSNETKEYEENTATFSEKTFFSEIQYETKKTPTEVNHTTSFKEEINETTEFEEYLTEYEEQTGEKPYTTEIVLNERKEYEKTESVQLEGHSTATEEQATELIEYEKNQTFAPEIYIESSSEIVTRSTEKAEEQTNKTLAEISKSFKEETSITTEFKEYLTEYEEEEKSENSNGTVTALNEKTESFQSEVHTTISEEEETTKLSEYEENQTFAQEIHTESVSTKVATEFNEILTENEEEKTEYYNKTETILNELKEYNETATWFAEHKATSKVTVSHHFEEQMSTESVKTKVAEITKRTEEIEETSKHKETSETTIKGKTSNVNEFKDTGKTLTETLAEQHITEASPAIVITELEKELKTILHTMTETSIPLSESTVKRITQPKELSTEKTTPYRKDSEPTEEFDENALEVFTVQERSTLCELCNEALIPLTESAVKIITQPKRLSTEKTTSYKKSGEPTEEFDENEVQGFTIQEHSTLCELCNEESLGSAKTTKFIKKEKIKPTSTLKNISKAITTATPKEEIVGFTTKYEETETISSKTEYEQVKTFPQTNTILETVTGYAETSEEKLLKITEPAKETETVSHTTNEYTQLEVSSKATSTVSSKEPRTSEKEEETELTSRTLLENKTTQQVSTGFKIGTLYPSPSQSSIVNEEAKVEPHETTVLQKETEYETSKHVAQYNLTLTKQSPHVTELAKEMETVSHKISDYEELEGSSEKTTPKKFTTNYTQTREVLSTIIENENVTEFSEAAKEKVSHLTTEESTLEITPQETVTISQKSEEQTTAASFAYSKEGEISTRKLASTTVSEELSEATIIFEESERTASEVGEYVETASVTQETSQEETLTISYIPEEESTTTSFQHNKEIEILTPKFTSTTFTEELPEATRIIEGSERTASEIEEYENIKVSMELTTASSKQLTEESSQSEEIERTLSMIIENNTLYSELTESTATSEIEEQVSNETEEYEEITETFYENISTYISEIQHETKKTPTETNHTKSFKEETNEATEFKEYMTNYEEETAEKSYNTETVLNEIKEHKETESFQSEGYTTTAEEEQTTEITEYEENQTFAQAMFTEPSSEISVRTTKKAEEETNETPTTKFFKEENNVITVFKEYLTQYEEEEITEKPNVTVTLLNEMEEYEETASFQSEGPTATVYEGQKTTLEEYEGHQTFLQEMYAESSSVNTVGPTEKSEEKTKKSSIEATITKYFKELTETRETTEFNEYLTGYEEEEIPEKPNGTEIISKEMEEYEETESLESERPTTTVEEKQTTKLSEYEKIQTPAQEIYTEIPSEIFVSTTEQTKEQTNETLAEVTSTTPFKEETSVTTEFKEYLSEYEEEEISEKSNGTVTALNKKTESFPPEELTTISEEEETTKLSEYEENQTFTQEIYTEFLSEIFVSTTEQTEEQTNETIAEVTSTKPFKEETILTTEFKENLSEYEEEEISEKSNGTVTVLNEKTESFPSEELTTASEEEETTKLSEYEENQTFTQEIYTEISSEIFVSTTEQTEEQTNETLAEVTSTTPSKEETILTTEFKEYLSEYEEEEISEKSNGTITALNEKTESFPSEELTTVSEEEETTKLSEYEENQTFTQEIYTEISSEIFVSTTEQTEEQTNETLAEVTSTTPSKEETILTTEFKEYLSEYEEEEISEKSNGTITALNEKTESFPSEELTTVSEEEETTKLSEYEENQTFTQEIYTEISSEIFVSTTEQTEEQTNETLAEVTSTTPSKEETILTTEFKEYLSEYEEEEISEKSNGTITALNEKTESFPSEELTTVSEEEETTKLSEYEENQTFTQEIYTEISSEIFVSTTEQTEEQTNETLAEVTSTTPSKEETILTTEFKEYLSEYEEEEISEKSNGTITALNEKTESFPSEELTTVSEEEETTKLSEYEENQTFTQEIYTEISSEIFVSTTEQTEEQTNETLAEVTSTTPSKEETILTTEFKEYLSEYEEEEISEKSNGTITALNEKTESFPSEELTTVSEEEETTKLSEYEENQTFTQEIYTEISSEIFVSTTEQTEEQTNETLAEVTSTTPSKEETILTTEFKEYLSEYEEEEISEKSNGTITALNEKTESFPSEELTTVSEEEETTKLSEYEENQTFTQEIYTEFSSEIFVSTTEQTEEQTNKTQTEVATTKSSVTTEFKGYMTEYEAEPEKHNRTETVLNEIEEYEETESFQSEGLITTAEGKQTTKLNIYGENQTFPQEMYTPEVLIRTTEKSEERTENISTEATITKSFKKISEITELKKNVTEYKEEYITEKPIETETILNEMEKYEEIGSFQSEEFTATLEGQTTNTEEMEEQTQKSPTEVTITKSSKEISEINELKETSEQAQEQTSLQVEYKEEETNVEENFTQYKPPLSTFSITKENKEWSTAYEKTRTESYKTELPIQITAPTENENVKISTEGKTTSTTILFHKLVTEISVVDINNLHTTEPNSTFFIENISESPEEPPIYTQTAVKLSTVEPIVISGFGHRARTTMSSEETENTFTTHIPFITSTEAATSTSEVENVITEETSTHKKETIPTEAFDKDELPGFTAHQGSTLCELCKEEETEKNENIANTTEHTEEFGKTEAENRTTAATHFSFIASTETAIIGTSEVENVITEETSTHKKETIPTEEFNEEDLQDFTAHQGSTLCKLCKEEETERNENRTNTTEQIESIEQSTEHTEEFGKSETENRTTAATKSLEELTSEMSIKENNSELSVLMQITEVSAAESKTAQSTSSSNLKYSTKITVSENEEFVLPTIVSTELENVKYITLEEVSTIKEHVLTVENVHVSEGLENSKEVPTEPLEIITHEIIGSSTIMFNTTEQFEEASEEVNEEIMGEKISSTTLEPEQILIETMEKATSEIVMSSISTSNATEEFEEEPEETNEEFITEETHTTKMMQMLTALEQLEETINTEMPTEEETNGNKIENTISNTLKESMTSVPPEFYEMEKITEIKMPASMERPHSMTTYPYATVHISEEKERTKTFKGLNISDAFKFSTTLMLLLTSVYGNYTTPTETASLPTTMPSIYVDLPVFLPNATSTAFPEHFIKIISNNATETLILFLNGPKNEASKKLNGSKWIRRLDQAGNIYMSKQEQPPQISIPLRKSDLPSFVSLDDCKKGDFEKNDRCFCAVDSLLSSLRQSEVAENTSAHLECTNFFKLRKGVIIGNESVPHVRKKRSYLFGKYDVQLKREVVDYSKGFFDEEFKIRNSEARIYALVGSKVVIPCLNRHEVVEYNRYMQYMWTFEDEVAITDPQIQENEGNLLVDNVVPKDSGNYTCSVKSRLNEKSNVVQKYYHRLVVVSTPIYKITTSVVYNLREPCELSDGDVISFYFPNILNGLLCGYHEKMCKVDVRRPLCINKEEEKLINVTFTATMFALKDIVPGIDANICNLNCQIELYSKLAAILVKNIETFAKLPVFSKLSLKEQDFKPKDIVPLKKKEKGRWSTPPVLMVTCPSGFGVEKKEPRICVVCPKNTYNVGLESYCRMCPAGQYQPIAGSSSCIICSSPLENRACLRVLYANTEHFKLYVGLAFGIVAASLILIFFCTRNGKSGSSTNGKRHHHVYSALRKDADVEKGVNEPLLGKDNDQPTRYGVPPQVPPPDF